MSCTDRDLLALFYRLWNRHRNLGKTQPRDVIFARTALILFLQQHVYTVLPFAHESPRFFPEKQISALVSVTIPESGFPSQKSSKGFSSKKKKQVFPVDRANVLISSCHIFSTKEFPGSEEVGDCIKW